MMSRRELLKLALLALLRIRVQFGRPLGSALMGLLAWLDAAALALEQRGQR